jgi:ferredoxin-NADP reductase
MAEQVVKIVSITKLTHNIKSYKVQKPEDFVFTSGQAVELAVNQKRWENEPRPFSIVSLPKDNELEFLIKSYRDSRGVTAVLDTLKRDAELLLGDPWDSYVYKGPGIFLAGGTGVTPFLSIFRQLNAEGRLAGNRLVWANTTEHDTFNEEEFIRFLDGGYMPTVGRIKASAIRKLIKPAADWVYICGPEAFEEATVDLVTELGVATNKIVREVE